MTESMTAIRRLELLFWLGTSLLLCHELDAVMQSEWRVLPFTSWMPDGPGYVVFVLMHVPLFALPLWAASSLLPNVRWRTQIGIDAFLLIHCGLHLAFSGHPAYTFDNLLSNGLIFGAGAVGAVHGARVWRLRPKGNPH